MLGVLNIRSKYITLDTWEKLLVEMDPLNSLALRVCLETGLRIDDVLSLVRSDLERPLVDVLEHKTGKYKTVSLRDELRAVLLWFSNGEFYLFPHRTKPYKHRSRVTVYQDLKKACLKLNIDPLGISPHSTRKTYAVELYRTLQSLSDVQKDLQHSYITTTMIYALSDKI